MKTPNELICFHATELPSSGKPPEWIMYAPAGENRITAHLDGKMRKLRVTVDKETAEVLQRDLLARRAAGGPQPFFDFHHEGKDAAGYPQEFTWDNTRGVLCRTEWSPAGAAAITCAKGQRPAIRYFSPRAGYDDEAERITGLMPEETGNAAGGLVSDPAFTRISPLTAAKAAAQAADQTKQTEDMTKPNLAAFVAAGLLTQVEADNDNALELLATRAKELKDKAHTPDKPDDSKVTELTASVASLQTELKAAKQRAGTKFVKELCASGKIPPAAEKLKARWLKDYMEDPDAAEEAAKELTATKALNPNPLTDDTDIAATGTANAPDPDRVLAKANELVASKAYPNLEAAWNAAVNAVKAA